MTVVQLIIDSAVNAACMHAMNIRQQNAGLHNQMCTADNVQQSIIVLIRNYQLTCPRAYSLMHVNCMSTLLIHCQATPVRVDACPL
jgi:hypothetical protein